MLGWERVVAIDGEKKVQYRHGAGLDASADSVGVITQRHRTATGKVTLRDYDFKRPQLDLTSTARSFGNNTHRSQPAPVVPPLI